MLEHCLEKLGEQAVRLTKNREVLLEVLHKAVGPLSPPEIVKECHGLGRQANKTTIYRELERMEKAGVVQRVILSDRKQYFELTERGHHHHLVCTSCDQMQDIAIEDDRLVAQAEMIGKKYNFLITTHTIEFFGLCKQCS